MVSVLYDYSNFDVGENSASFMKASNLNRNIEIEESNDSILEVNNLVKGDCQFSEFDEKTFHRSKEIVEEENYLTIYEQRNIEEALKREYTNKDPPSIIFNTNIFIGVVEFFIDIYIMTEKRIDSLSKLFHPLFYFILSKSNARFIKFVGLVMIFLFMIVQSRNSNLQHNYETLRLFSQYSLVKDFYHGELSLLQEKLQLSDMTFVLYYAPWDRDSQDVKYHFLKVAAYHHEQIAFAAINCWLPGSECRSHYKLQHFPILVLHIRVAAADETLNVPYNGPLNSHHIIRFLSFALRPYIHVSSQADVLALQLDYQAVVLGYYEAGDDNRDFLIFYYAALSKLQFNHMREVVYALVTNPTLARIFSFAHVSSIQLIVWNTTFNYPNETEQNIRNITQFVDLHLFQVAKWININGRKGSSLNNILKEGPFLIIMTPDNPYHSSNDLFRILRSVALEYHNCHNSSRLLWLSKHLNLKTRSSIRVSDQICRQYLKSHLQYQSTIHDTFHDGLYEDQHLHLKEFNYKEQLCVNEEPNFLQISWNSLLAYIDNQPSLVSYCLKESKLTDSCQNCSCKINTEAGVEKLYNERKKAEADAMTGIEDFGVPYEDDIISSLSNWLAEEHCKKLILGSLVSPPPIIKEESYSLTIPGLHCKTNRTLKFFTLDSLLHEDFINHLGINFTTGVQKYTGAIIIDPDAEERYILKQPISRGALVSFIYNFTYNLLTRSKLSDQNGFHFDDCDERHMCVSNLNADNYVAVTHKMGQTYVVLHYTRNCGACSAISHLLLTCMHITSDISSLKFAKIDSSLNILPWHLTFDIVPTIVMYPAFKKSESRVLDTTTPITIRSLMVLISYGLSSSDRLKLAMKVCDLKCQQLSKKKSTLTMRKLQLSINDVNLRYQRYIALLVKTKHGLNNNNKMLSHLKLKYDLLLDLKYVLNLKLKKLRKKIKHLQSLSRQYPNVPYNFSTLLSFETSMLTESSKLS